MSGPPSARARPAFVIADLVSALFARILDADGLLDPEDHHRTLVLRVRVFTARHLHDPRLTPDAVAAAHHISVSYLHRQ